jgi:proline-specific peptidase
MSVATSLDNSYDGHAPFDYPAANKPLQTYYRIFGDLKSSTAPLICIHGGPGLCHDYLLNHSYLTHTNGTPVVFYDQIGSGRSSRLPETATVKDFWTEEIFLEQLRQLLVFLGIEMSFDVLGSSWGGMLGSQFAATRPAGLRRLILANAAASKALSLANSNIYRKCLPQESQDAISKAEGTGNFDNKDFSAAMELFREKHVCHISPLPEDLLASVRLSREDRTVTMAMSVFLGPFLVI